MSNKRDDSFFIGWAAPPSPLRWFMVLLGFLILMNALAVLLRKRFERQW